MFLEREQVRNLYVIRSTKVSILSALFILYFCYNSDIEKSTDKGIIPFISRFSV